MKRLYFLSPSLHATSSIVEELHQYRIQDRHIHVVGNDHAGLVENHLHEASVLQTSDIIPAAERGAAAGVTTGLLAGLIAVSFPPAGFVLGGGAVLGLTLFGAGFGAWASSMIGISIPNKTVEQYEAAIAAGQFLVMVDVPKADQPRVTDLIKKHHPGASIENVDIGIS